MKRVLRIMIDIFQPEGIDWMNFALSKSNPYTFHHIVEKSKGGDKSIDNGAILAVVTYRFILLTVVGSNAVLNRICHTNLPVLNFKFWCTKVKWLWNMNKRSVSNN